MIDPQHHGHALAEVRAGNRDAFRDVIRATAGLLRPLVTAYVHHDEAANDVLQDAYVKIFQQVGRYQPGTNCVAWIKSVARYEALTARQAYLREQRRRDRYRVEVENCLGAALAAPDQEAAIEGRLEALQGCLKKLAERARLIVELHYFQGHALEFVAQTLSMNTNAVRVALHRARQLLALCVESKGESA